MIQPNASYDAQFNDTNSYNGHKNNNSIIINNINSNINNINTLTSSGNNDNSYDNTSNSNPDKDNKIDNKHIESKGDENRDHKNISDDHLKNYASLKQAATNNPTTTTTTSSSTLSRLKPYVTAKTEFSDHIIYSNLPGKKRVVDVLLDCLQLMKSQPKSVPFSLSNPALEQFDVAKILEIVHFMGVVADAGTYSLLMQKNQRHFPREQDRLLLQEMRAHGFVPDFITYLTLMRNEIQRGSVPHAKAWYEQMLAEGLEPSLEVFAELSIFLARKGEHDYCLKIIQDMKSWGWT